MRIPVYKVFLARERSVSTDSRTITSPADAYAILAAFIGDTDREQFVVLLLDCRKRPIGINTVSIGNLNSNLVHPRELMKPAILANAASIILCHNHPSGDANPSPEDVAITEQLKNAGEILGIPIIDHMIIGHDSFYSFKQQGLL